MKQKQVCDNIVDWLSGLGYFDNTFSSLNIKVDDLYYYHADDEFGCERYIRFYAKQTDEFVIGLPYPTYIDVMSWLADLETVNVKFDIENCSYKIDGDEFRLSKIPLNNECKIAYIIEDICRRRLITTPKLDIADRAEKMAKEVYGMSNVGSEKYFEKEGYKKAIITHLFDM